MQTKAPRFLVYFVVLLGGIARPVTGDATVPAVFGDHMVLQREQPIPVWGRAEPRADVEVSIAGQSVRVAADAEGRWRVELEALPAGGPHTLSIRTEASALDFEDVLIGDVWVCAGQSNMGWPVKSSAFAELEALAARQAGIRFLKVPNRGSQEPQWTFEGSWAVCSPETVRDFSAVGYFFARWIHEIVGVPVGLIDLSWGGSSAEAWVPRDVLEEDPRYTALLREWDERVATYQESEHERLLEQHREAMARWQAAGARGPRPQSVNHPRTGQHRPANIFNGKVAPVLGFGIRGMIWYQGESNTSRADDYRCLFPTVISTLRERWGRGEFPFYWAQLAGFRAASDEPQDSDWARLREAQTLATEVPGTGQAVIFETGEANDIHPRDKHTVANRLAAWALAGTYGFDLAHRSPQFDTMEIVDGAARITFRDVGERGLFAFDQHEVIGFALAGEDRVFHWAEAEITGPREVVVRSAQVPAPVAVRYAWADNPKANLFDRNGLPVTPFRTDTWEFVPPAAAD